MLSLSRLLRYTPKSLGGAEFLDPIRSPLVAAATQRGLTEACWMTEAQRKDLQLDIRGVANVVTGGPATTTTTTCSSVSVTMTLPIASSPTITLTNVGDLCLPHNVDAVVLQEFAQSKLYHKGPAMKKETLHKTVTGGFFAAAASRFLDQRIKLSMESKRDEVAVAATPRLFAKYWVSEEELSILGWTVSHGAEFVELPIAFHAGASSLSPKRVVNVQQVNEVVDYSEFFRVDRRIFGLRSGRQYSNTISLPWQALLMTPIEHGGAGFSKVDVLTKREFRVGGTLVDFAHMHAKDIASQHLRAGQTPQPQQHTTEVVSHTTVAVPAPPPPPRGDASWLLKGAAGTVAMTNVGVTGVVEQLIVAAQTTLAEVAVQAAAESRQVYRQKCQKQREDLTVT
jgi:hypothetical protein